LVRGGRRGETAFGDYREEGIVEEVEAIVKGEKLTMSC